MKYKDSSVSYAAADENHTLYRSADEGVFETPGVKSSGLASSFSDEGTDTGGSIWEKLATLSEERNGRHALSAAIQHTDEVESIPGLRATVTTSGGEDYQTAFEAERPTEFRFYDSSTTTEQEAKDFLNRIEERKRRVGTGVSTSVMTETELKYARVLREHGLPENRVQTVISRMKVTGEHLVTVMREFAFMKPEEVARVYAEIETGTQFLSEKECADLIISSECIKRFSAIPGEQGHLMASYSGIIPFEIYHTNERMADGVVSSQERCKVLVANPGHIGGVTATTGMLCDVYISTESALHSLYRRYYSSTEQEIDVLIERYRDIDDKGQDLAEESPNLPSELLGNILRYACNHKVSDVYMLCTGSAGLVRLKSEGTGMAFKTIPLSLYDMMLASMLPAGVGKRDVEDSVMRDATLMPTEFLKEKFPDVFGRFNFRLEFGFSKGNMTAVMRLLDTETDVASLDSLDFDPVSYANLVRYRDSSKGLIIVTGPTGSGKTTTLYAILNGIDAILRSVQTIENPVEYKNGLWMQYPVNSKMSSQQEGEAFGLILKGLLRNAPDVILVGEVRDSDTASTLMDASNTGHLVFTTLHTNSAALSIGRLRKLGVNQDDLANQLLGILAQRLVRVVCPKCGCKPDAEKAGEIAEILHDYLPESEMVDFDIASLRVASEAGCDYCNHTGYKGRHIVYEMLDNNAEVQKLIEKNEPLSTISQKGLRPYYHLWHSGLRLVKDGVSSLDEVKSVVSPEIWLMSEVAAKKQV